MLVKIYFKSSDTSVWIKQYLKFPTQRIIKSILIIWLSLTVTKLTS